jgi:mono/diheme cytochrome c family protein
MKSKTLITCFLLSGFLLKSCAPTEKPAQADTPEPVAVAAKMSHEDHVKRGAYLVEIMGCHDCHSPKIMTDQGPAPDPSRLLSGHPADEKLAAIADKKILQNYALFNMGLTAGIGPWGTSFSANLTPDDTGLGAWTIDQFAKAIREGKSKGMDNTRMLLPPMPWQNLRNISDEDLAAIWAYLQSIPPVKNAVPAPIPPAG